MGNRAVRGVPPLFGPLAHRGAQPAVGPPKDSARFDYCRLD